MGRQWSLVITLIPSLDSLVPTRKYGMGIWNWNETHFKTKPLHESAHGRSARTCLTTDTRALTCYCVEKLASRVCMMSGTKSEERKKLLEGEESEDEQLGVTGAAVDAPPKYTAQVPVQLQMEGGRMVSATIVQDVSGMALHFNRPCTLSVSG